MITKLLVKRPTDTNYTSVNLFDTVPYSITYSVADIRNPENRNGSYSKTINIPGSKANNALFEFIFNVNSALQTFNPNLKCDAILLQEDVEVFKGNLRLATIHRVGDYITYDVELFGNVKSLFDAISNLQLTDVDLSAFNHIRTKANQVTSWSAPVGSGYVYPLVNNGLDNIYSANPLFSSSNMYPALYVKSIVDGIFADAGYTYTSSFFITDLFKRLIIPSVGKAGGHSVTLTANMNISNVLINVSGSYGQAGVGIQIGYIQMIRINAVNGTTQLIATANFHGAGAGSTNYTLTATNIVLNQGDTVYIQFANGNGNVKFDVNTASWVSVYTDGSGSFTGLVTSPVTYIVSANSSTNLVYQSETDPNGVLNIATGVHTVPVFNMQGYLPDNVLQKDLLLGLIRMFNLYIEVDKNITGNLLIEPRDNYYAAGAVKDWTHKLATDRELTIVPLCDLDTRQFLFQFTPDKDFYNNLYTNGDKIGLQSYTGWQEVYGQQKVNVTNDFVSKITTIQPVFSPTVMSAIGNTSIVIPQIITKEPSSPIPNGFIPNIRILYWGGMKTGSWQHANFSGTTQNLTYPYAGHLDDVQAPTLDINYGVPKQVFYSMSNTALFTNNNLYNAYWSKRVTEMTDKDSKFVAGWFYLNPSDINLLDFRDTIKVDEQYYKINRVIEYSPTETELTKVELTKMNATVPFVASTDNLGVLVFNPSLYHITNGNNTNTNTGVLTANPITHKIPIIKHGGNNKYNATNSNILHG